MLKFAFNLIDDGLVGQQVFAGEATRLAYMTDEAAGGPRRLPREARARLVRLPLALLRPHSWPSGRCQALAEGRGIPADRASSLGEELCRQGRGQPPLEPGR